MLLLVVAYRGTRHRADFVHDFVEKYGVVRSVDPAQRRTDCTATDHSEAAESTAIEVNVPDFEAFTGPENFGEVCDHYERTVLKARNEVVAAATENSLSELAKKKPGLKQRGEQGD